jgi:exodeoxyribonuclease VII small subunit
MSIPPSPTFETLVESLQTKVRALESGQLPLEDSLKVFEEGVQIMRICQEKLSQAEKKISILTKGEQGPEFKDFNQS